MAFLSSAIVIYLLLAPEVLFFGGGIGTTTTFNPCDDVASLCTLWCQSLSTHHCDEKDQLIHQGKKISSLSNFVLLFLICFQYNKQLLSIISGRKSLCVESGVTFCL